MRNIIFILLFLPLFGFGQHHMMSTLAAQAEPDLSSNLLFVWELDETSGTTAQDATAANFDGTTSGALVNQTGKIGKAYFFLNYPGNDRVYNSSFGPATNATLSIWFNPTVGNVDCDRVIGFEGYDLDLAVGDDYVVQVYDGSWNDDIYTLSEGTWYHMVLTLNSSTGWKLYINGSLIKTDPTTRTLSGYIALGCSYNFTPSPVNCGSGTFDQFAAWEKVLSEAEILYLYNSGNGRAYSTW